MSQPEGVARLWAWGQQKGKHTMNYEKLSRALRYYKGGNILVRKSGCSSMTSCQVNLSPFPPYTERERERENF